MKNKSYLSLCFLPLFFMIVALFPACKKNNDSVAAPVVKSVRLYVASPNDIELSNGDPKTSASIYGNGGIYVAIVGNNLKNATEIDFDGVPATFNTALFSPNSAVVKIPIVDYATVDTTKLYTLAYKTPGGSTTFWFKLGPMVPTISAISDVFANPGDSVYLYGANLLLVQQFIYGGTKIPSFNPSADGTSLGFRMPAATPTSEIVVTTKSGTVRDTINATPTITGISNENAIPGDSVHIYGTYFKSIQKISFAGQAITSFTSSKDGKSLGIVMPLNATSGPASITTKFGTVTTVYNVHDLIHGLIANWEWDSSTDIFGNLTWDGGSFVTGNPANAQSWLPYNPDFSGNLSKFSTLKTSVLQPEEGFGNGWPPTYQLGFDQEQWIPKANLSDPIQNYALKFEISIPQAWNGGALNIEVDANSTFIYRWEPWQKSGTTVDYTTKGWITLTVPFTEFRKTDATLGDGRGVSMTKFSDILDSSGKSKCYIYLHNYASSATATGFYGAFDNLRVVKIK